MKQTIFKTMKIKYIFIFIFIILNIYYLLIKTELYESKTALIVRDMSQNTASANLGLSLLGLGDDSSQLQDSKIVEEYLKSFDVYTMVDEKFNLTQHYKSDAIDFIGRLSSDATAEEVLEFYNKHLNVYYDEVSGILSVAFSHVEPKKTQEILQFLVENVEYQINEFNRTKAKKELKFVNGEFLAAKKKMEESSKELEDYQNKHILLDPTNQASSSTGIISGLEAQITQKKIDYSAKKNYLNSNSYELLSLQNEIKEMESSMKNLKEKLSGSQDNRLNKVLFAYEKLKLQLEFDTEVYKNVLIQLETTKIDVMKNNKTLSILSKANLPDGYTYPDKPKVFVTILILTLLLYGIVSMLGSIIRDHKE